MTAEDGWLWDAQAISDGGERATHLHKNHFFYAHLSLYDFATRFCRDAVVLDAGSGAGYGAAHLAAAGARHVVGIDLSPKAIAFSRHHFPRPNLEFREMNLEQISGFAPGSFDFIFTSNTLEHVPNVSGFLRAAWSLLKPVGILLVAVPPITDDRLCYLNLINRYHVNIWSPRQWQFALGQFFGEITPYLHGVERLGEDFKPEHTMPNSLLTEKSFVIEPGTVDDMYRIFTLTAIFLARKPRPEAELPPADAPLAFVDGSFTRPPGVIPSQVRKKLRGYFEPEPPPLSRAAGVARRQGVWALIRQAVAFVRSKRGDR